MLVLQKGLEGNSWEAYLVAFNALSELERSGLGEALQSEAKGSADRREAAVLDEALSEAGPSLDLLGEGARRAELRFTTCDPEGKDPRPVKEMKGARLAGRLLCCRGRRRIATSDESNGILDFATTLQCGLDLMRGPTVYANSGAELVWIACAELHRFILTHGSQDVHYEWIRGFLAAADASWPGFASSLQYAACLYFDDMQETMAASPNLLLRLGEWRHGCSFQLAYCDFLDSLRKRLAQVRNGEELPWKDASSSYRPSTVFYPNFGASPLDMDQVYEDLDHQRRRVRARLRLLIGTLAVMNGENPKDKSWPRDPFTLAPLAMSSGPETIELTCIWEGTDPSDWDDPAFLSSGLRIAIRK